MKVTIRKSKPEDAEACGNICYEAFAAISNYHNFPPDFPSEELAIGLLTHTFSREDIYTTVAEIEGKIVGSNVFWENGEIVGVGPITINSNVQKESIGRALMEDGMKYAISISIGVCSWHTCCCIITHNVVYIQNSSDSSIRIEMNTRCSMNTIKFCIPTSYFRYNRIGIVHS